MKKQMKKSGKNKIVLFLLIGVLLLNICFVVSAETKPYNPENPETWYSSEENLRQLMSDLGDENKLNKLNSVLDSNSLSKEQRNYIFKRILNYNPHYNRIIIKGFGNKGLKFLKSENGELKIGDDVVSLNIDQKLPDWVSEIEFIPEDGISPSRFVYRDKNGAELVLEEGFLNKKGEIDGIEGYEGFKPVFDEENQKITVLKKGDLSPRAEGIILENNAKISFNDLVFSQSLKNEKAYLIRPEENHFETSNLVMDRGDIKVTSPDHKTTDIILGDKVEIYNKNQYVKINGEKIDMIGENIELELKEDSENPYWINAKGNNLIMKNEGVVYKVDGKTTIMNRRVGDYKDLHSFVLKNMEDKHVVSTEKYFAISDEALGVKPTEEELREIKLGSKVSVMGAGGNKKVCIGEFCELRGSWGGKLDNPIRPYSSQPESGEMLISQSKVYGYESEITKLIGNTPKGLSKSEFAQYAARDLANVELVSVVKTDWITPKAINKNINEMIAPLGLPQSELNRIEKFKLEQIYPNMERGFTTKYIKPGSVVTIMSTDRGEVYGSFTITMNGRNYAIKIPGRYLQRAVALNLKEYGSTRDSTSLDILYQRYQTGK